MNIRQIMQSMSSSENCYLIIDPQLVKIKDFSYNQCFKNDYTLLFAGTILENYAELSPVIFCLSPNTKDIIQWFILPENIISGICFVSSKNMLEIRNHFHHFIFVKRYDDLDIMWRLYDPFIISDIEYTMGIDLRKSFLLVFKEIYYTAPDRSVRKYSGVDSHE